MYDTTIMLKPREQWRPGMTYEKLIQEMDAKLQFPGLTNTWTMPVRNRLDMELTGIKTAVGLKVQGPDLGQIQEIGEQMQQTALDLAGRRAVFAERVSQGFYLNVEVNRPEAARYGLTVADVQRVITLPDWRSDRRRERRGTRSASRSTSAMSAISATIPKRWAAR